MCKSLFCDPHFLALHKGRPIYIYINKDGNPFTKSTRQVNANVNTRKKNLDHQNISNEVEDVMLKRHPMPQSANDGGALTGMCGRDEVL